MKINLMAYSKILFFCVLVRILCFRTMKAQDTPLSWIGWYCSSGGSSSGFQVNLMTLLNSLSSKAIGNTGFHNTTVADPSDPVYGLFMCRGDLPSPICLECVANAIQELPSLCPLSNQATIWYNECMLRYSNNSFFSTFDKMSDFGGRTCNTSTTNVSQKKSLTPLLFSIMNKTADEAASPHVGDNNKKFATNEANVSKIQTIYCLAQCTPDLSPNDCRTCLSRAIAEPDCDEELGGYFYDLSCTIRYEVYPFYRSINVPSPDKLVLQTNYPKQESRFSQDPLFLGYDCPSNYSTITYTNFKLFLSYLSTNATSGQNYHTTIVEDMVYGFFLCRGDLPSRLCGQCVNNATNRMYPKCLSAPEGIIWYSHCLVFYSYLSLFHRVDKSPVYTDINVTKYSILDKNLFISSTLSNQLSQLATDTGNSEQRYMTNSLKLNDKQTLYSLGQCTPSLSSEDCISCLNDVISTSIPWSFLGSVGGRIIYPSCNLRFELFQFYMGAGDEARLLGSASPLSRNIEKRTIIIIVVPFITLAMIFFACSYFLRRRRRKSRRTILRENFGEECATLEPLQFDWAIIETATNNFSRDNFIGKGGFGEVYKGILLDGQEVAIKRLSKSSKQGVEEFKNEVLLIAKLQHRNLVTFIGFCLEKDEKILIYEFVPNKSLDYFLFDAQRSKMLTWVERFNIIGGIARGIFYLHELSRLKVIHRDLKPSNILLDENMIPKISDFGLARIVEISQDEGNTNRIAGTYGYMSPEYLMSGYFSEKSDVYSFGVMLLEIVAGKKNRSVCSPHHVVDGLLNYVWRQWSNQTPLTILDENVKEDYSKTEVFKCIQIGLLCVQHDPNARPSMVTVTSYLSSDLIELPTPHEPAFFMQGRSYSNAHARELGSIQSNNCNKMSASTFIPR